jgi:hypothetical protein
MDCLLKNRPIFVNTTPVEIAPIRPLAEQFFLGWSFAAVLEQFFEFAKGMKGGQVRVFAEPLEFAETQVQGELDVFHGKLGLAATGKITGQIVVDGRVVGGNQTGFEGYF